MRGDRPRRCAGNARGVARPMPCNACIENVQTLYVCCWWFPALSLLHTGGKTTDPSQELIAQVDQIMIGGERRNLSNNTAMLRGLAQLFVHIPQSMHMPQPKIILKKRGLRKRGLELYGIPEQIGKIPEKSGKSQKGRKRTKKEGQVQIGKPPRLKHPRLAALDNCARSMSQTPAQYWIKIVHPWVQKLYPVLGLGSGERLLWHFQAPVLHWITFSLRVTVSSL